jgi:hypothetical protein
MTGVVGQPIGWPEEGYLTLLNALYVIRRRQ